MRPSQIRIDCVSPALVGRFFTMEVPGKPRSLILDLSFSSVLFRILEIVLRYIVHLHISRIPKYNFEKCIIQINKKWLLSELSCFCSFHKLYIRENEHRGVVPETESFKAHSLLYSEYLSRLCSLWTSLLPLFSLRLCGVTSVVSDSVWPHGL